MMLRAGSKGSTDQKGIVRYARKVGEQKWLYNTAEIFELSEPIEWEEYDRKGKTRFVIVSVGIGIDHGPWEAMAFACDEKGELLPDGDSRCEVGVKVGTSKHADVVREMGFEVESDEI